MAKTVDEGFREFHSRLTPTGGESEAAKRHRASIQACLRRNFDLQRFFRTGSFGNGTSIRGFSDVDYFAVIPRENLKKVSSYTLRDVRDALDETFPRTGVAVRTPGVLVPFGVDASESTEVIPADYIRTEHDCPVYDIADGYDGWANSSPDMHNTYVAVINNKLGYKAKPLIRFIKAWKVVRNVPINSFYLELRAAKYAAEESIIVYSIDVKNVFKLLWDCQLAAMQDPMGISGYIYPCSTASKKEDALSKLGTAYDRALKALAAENAGSIGEAFAWWDLVFNYNFPSR